MTYDFLAIDEGKQNLIRANTDGRVRWMLDLGDFPTARAMQRITDDEALIGYDRGYFTVRISSGDVVHHCRKWTKVTSAHRLEDGQTLITGLNLGDSRGIWVLKLDALDRVVDSQSRKGNYVRLLEPNGDDGYMLCVNRSVIETDRELNTLREFKAKGFKHAWKARRLEDGSTLVSAGYGAFMARFDTEGVLIQSFGEKGVVPPEIKPFFYASFCLTDDGYLLVANWQGHGETQGQKGRQLLCFTQNGDYVESWSFPEIVSSLQGLLVL